MPRFRIRKSRGEGEPEVKMLSAKEVEKIEKLEEVFKHLKNGKENNKKLNTKEVPNY